MNKNNIWILIMGVLLLQACLKDEGNYSYKELEPIEIGESGLKESYRITQLTYLQVSPDVKQGEADSYLAYEWKIFQESNVPNVETGKVVDDVVGTERELNYLVTTPVGDYTLALKVTDTRNGVSEMIRRNLRVESFAPQGLMIAHGDADSTDVSILVNDRVVSDADKDGVIHNIFSTTNGHRAPGAPAKVAYAYNIHSVYVFTKGSQGGFRSRGSDLKILDSYADMFEDRMPGNEINFQGYNQWSYNDLLINGGKLYFAGQASATFVKFGIPAFGMEYYAEPYIGVNERGYYFGVFYDRLNRRFLKYTNQKVMDNFKSVTGAAFDMNDVGKDMVYAEHGFNKMWYCVMRDPQNVTGHSVYVCDLTKADNGTSIIGVGKYDVGGCADMKDAKAFAVGNRAEILYYATSTEIKQCNYKGDGNAILRYQLDDDLIGQGYEITAMHLFKVSGSANEGKLLYVGIYSEITGEGKLLECPIVETNGEILSGQIKTYNGFKKIVDMAYKAR